MTPEELDHVIARLRPPPTPWYRNTITVVATVLGIIGALWTGAVYLFLPNARAAVVYQTIEKHDKDTAEADKERRLLLDAVAENQKAIQILNIEQAHQNKNIERLEREKRKKR